VCFRRFCAVTATCFADRPPLLTVLEKNAVTASRCTRLEVWRKSNDPAPRRNLLRRRRLLSLGHHSARTKASPDRLMFTPPPGRSARPGGPGRAGSATWGDFVPSISFGAASSPRKTGAITLWSVLLNERAHPPHTQRIGERFESEAGTSGVEQGRSRRLGNHRLDLPAACQKTAPSLASRRTPRRRAVWRRPEWAPRAGSSTAYWFQKLPTGRTSTALPGSVRSLRDVWYP